MPEATPFNSLGAGNGFPFCPETVDVSVYDKWITLGGTEKGNSPTASEIQLSIVNAMNLFWNLYQVNLTLTTSAVGSLTSDVNAVDDLDTGNELPRNRVCGGAVLSESISVGVGQEFHQTTISEFSSSNSIVRMVDSGGNFLGYGINSQGDFEDIISGGGGATPYGFYLDYQEDNSSEVLFVIACSYGDTPSPTYENEVEYTNLNGIPLLCCAASVLGTGGVDAVNLTVTSDQGADGDVTLSLDSLEFYTYP